jgi:hypothetical protein
LLWLFWSCVSQTICLDWSGTVILWISASPISRITGMRNCLDALLFSLCWNSENDIEKYDSLSSWVLWIKEYWKPSEASLSLTFPCPPVS